MNAELLDKATRALLRKRFGFTQRECERLPKWTLHIVEPEVAAVLRVVVEACAEEAAQCAIPGHTVSIASIEAACRRIRALADGEPTDAPMKN